jgi:hypothetical protein
MGGFEGGGAPPLRTAQAGSVAAALRLLAKYVLTGNLGRILPRLSERAEQVITGQLTAESTDGIGWRLIVAYFHEQHIDGMGEYTVKQQLANLKASGAYARIMAEVQAEIQREHEAALAHLAEAEVGCDPAPAQELSAPSGLAVRRRIIVALPACPGVAGAGHR